MKTTGKMPGHATSPTSSGGRSTPRSRTSSSAVLQATYEGSLDMPELEGTRGLEDILAGHQAAGLFVPERWRLGRIARRARGRGRAAPDRGPRAATPGRSSTWASLPPPAAAGWAAP